MLEIKGQVLHRVRLHGKVPGWLSNLYALPTKKFFFFFFFFIQYLSRGIQFSRASLNGALNCLSFCRV